MLRRLPPAPAWSSALIAALIGFGGTDRARRSGDAASRRFGRTDGVGGDGPLPRHRAGRRRAFVAAAHACRARLVDAGRGTPRGGSARPVVAGRDRDLRVGGAGDDPARRRTDARAARRAHPAVDRLGDARGRAPALLPQAVRARRGGSAPRRAARRGLCRGASTPAALCAAARASRRHGAHPAARRYRTASPRRDLWHARPRCAGLRPIGDPQRRPAIVPRHPRVAESARPRRAAQRRL